ncbi:MAG TPA: DNA replication and repair protein RecF [Candidatus Saccharimonadales bacterium]|nr:DNA replication and repair protein RecF [Candidatus Saccharimonadales bacterium]
MIDSIRLQNFRSYKDDSFEFEPGVNIVVGPNASGKTNLLEAVLVLARGNSWRVRDAELIQLKKIWARLDGNFSGQIRTAKVDARSGAAIKSFVIDDKPYRRLNLERTVATVFFEPNHLQLMIRGPEARRDYFDELLERSQPAFKSLVAGYRRTLAQRNALLKKGHAQAKPQLFAWNIRLSELGSQIAQARQNLVDTANKQLSRDYGRIAGQRTKVGLKYDCQFPVGNYASLMVSKLESSTGLDFERGFTGSGPHREDFIFTLGGRPVGATASRGETRSLLLALKIYELGLIEKARGAKPVFLLDDVFSELDGQRRRALVDNLKDYQTIITTTDAEAVLEYFATGAHNLISLARA